MECNGKRPRIDVDAEAHRWGGGGGVETGGRSADAVWQLVGRRWADFCTLCQFGARVSACCKKEREHWSSDLFIPVERLHPGQGTTGQKKMSLSQSNQGRAKVNKGDMEQEREEKWSRECGDETQGGKQAKKTQRERVTLTHGRIRSWVHWRKNKKNSFTEASQRNLQSWGVDHRISS